MSARYISAADTAKMIRKAIKARPEWKGTKFSVRTKSYSGGASVTVSWTDGPRACDVEAVVGRFAGATFDGMQDLKEYHSDVLVGEDGEPEEVHFGADFVFTSREISDDLAERLIQWGAERYGPGLLRLDGTDRRMAARNLSSHYSAEGEYVREDNSWPFAHCVSRELERLNEEAYRERDVEKAIQIAQDAATPPEDPWAHWIACNA